jgi:hypothetical protein
MVGFRMLQHNLLAFLKGFDGMDDLVVNIGAAGLSAAGTLDKAYFISRFTTYRDEETSIGDGKIAIGQLSTFTSLIRECGVGNEEVEIVLTDEGKICVTGESTSFTIPTINTASSQAGVEQVLKMLDESESSGFTKFGSGELGFTQSFEGQPFQQLRNTAKSIQNGALFCLESNVAGLTLSVKRDSIRMESILEPLTNNLADEGESVLNWFGKWLMDALKAMPGNGTVYLHGGNDSPLLIRHESPDGDFGTTAVIAPRQEEGGASA